MEYCQRCDSELIREEYGEDALEKWEDICESCVEDIKADLYIDRLKDDEEWH